MEQNKHLQEEMIHKIENHCGIISMKTTKCLNIFKKSLQQELKQIIGVKPKFKDILMVNSMLSLEEKYYLLSLIKIIAF